VKKRQVDRARLQHVPTCPQGGDCSVSRDRAQRAQRVDKQACGTATVHGAEVVRGHPSRSRIRASNIGHAGSHSLPCQEDDDTGVVGDDGGEAGGSGEAARPLVLGCLPSDILRTRFGCCRSPFFCLGMAVAFLGFASAAAGADSASSSGAADCTGAALFSDTGSAAERAAEGCTGVAPASLTAAVFFSGLGLARPERRWRTMGGGGGGG